MQTINPKQGTTSRSLSATLALVFAGLSLAVLFVSVILQLYFALQAQQEAVSNEQQRIAQDASLRVGNFLQARLTTLRTTVKLATPTTSSREASRQVLQSLLGLESAFRQIVFLNEQDKELASVSRLPEGSTVNVTGRLSSQALAQIRAGDTFISPAYIDAESSEPLVLMAVPATNAFGDFQGTLAAEVNLKFMWEVVDQLKVGDTGIAYLVDRRGKLLAFRDTSRVLKGENVSHVAEVSEFLNGATAEPFLDLFPGIDGNLAIGAYAPLGYPDWAIITELPWQESYAPFIQNAVSSLATILVLAVLAALVGVYLARRLAVPLVNLTETATQITAGKLNLQAPVQGTTEVAGLATAFNSMTSQLRQTLEGLEQRVLERTSALAASNTELEKNRNQLQASNAELEASRNQLQANNAELETSRNQLQTNNAELAANRDELQSTNQALESNKTQLETANQELQRNTLFLRALNETSVGLMGRLDVNELLATIMARAGALIGTENGYIYLVEPGHSEMTMRVGTGLYTDLVGAKTRPGRGLAGAIWETGEPLALADYQQWGNRLADPQRSAIRSVIGVPLKTATQVLGVIGLASTDPQQAYGQDELSIMNRFAQLATIALENARLFEQTQQRVVELSALNRIGEIVSTRRELPLLIDDVGDELAQIFDVKNLYIALYNAGSARVELPYVVTNGIRLTVPPLELGEGLVSGILRSRQPLLLNENAKQISAQMSSRQIENAAKSYLGVPIVVGDDAIGVLSIQSTEREGMFGDGQVSLLSTIATTVGIAIQNMRLFEQTQVALGATERMAQRERTVAEELQNLTARLTGEGWQKYLEQEPGDIWIEDSNAALNGGHREIQGMERAQETASLVLSNTDGHSTMALPIVLRGRVIGTIGLEDLDEGREWNEDELSIVKEVSDNVALALDNARLFTETQRRVTELDALNSISKGVTTELELAALLNIIGDQLQDVFDINNAYIALYDRGTQTISLPYFVDDGARLEVAPIPFGEGITSEIIRRRQAIVINTNAIEEMEKYGAKYTGNPARSYMGVPIFVGDDVTGVISIQNTAREGAFDTSNLRLLETIAATVGSSIQNATLYGAMQQEVVVRQQAEAEIKLSLQEKEVLLKEIHHRVKNNLQIITSLLNLQSAQLKDPEAITLFRESQARVRSMALIHEKLYQSKDLARIDFDGYVRDLMVYLFRSYAANPEHIRTHIETNNMFLAIDTAIPCGLIISELVTNTIKYAFPDGKRGDLHISLQEHDSGHLTLLVKDNGVGFPDDFKWRESDSLGLQLVDTLSSQLHGKIEVSGQGGTSFKITFPG